MTGRIAAQGRVTPATVCDLEPVATSLASVPGSPAALHAPTRAERAVAAWLLACCLLVFAIIVVGGVTRLTHSGLSITEWQPIVGTLPPLTDHDGHAAFNKYRATPEYQQVNKGMSLEAFKGIFWWEYFHRLLGRLIGVAFLVPFVWFAVKRMVPAGYRFQLAGIFALGGLQGAMGWYMVKSGLIDDARVSPFRLTAHLGLAFVIIGAMLWVALSLLRPRREAAATRGARSARRWAFGIVALVLLMVLTGGFVAGIRAGLAYNTFPLMNGAWIPAEILMFRAGVDQLLLEHGDRAIRPSRRRLAAVLPRAGAVVEAAHRGRLAGALLAALAIQVALGIATLLLIVPLPLAVLHQAGAAVVFAVAVYVAHAMR